MKLIVNLNCRPAVDQHDDSDAENITEVSENDGGRKKTTFAKRTLLRKAVNSKTAADEEKSCNTCERKMRQVSGALSRIVILPVTYKNNKMISNFLFSSW